MSWFRSWFKGSASEPDVTPKRLPINPATGMPVLPPEMRYNIRKASEADYSRLEYDSDYFQVRLTRDLVVEVLWDDSSLSLDLRPLIVFGRLCASDQESVDLAAYMVANSANEHYQARERQNKFIGKYPPKKMERAGD